MRQRQQSTTTYPIPFFLAQATDHLTGLTGQTPSVTISKNGGAFGPAAGAVSEVGNGWYVLAGNATDRATLGALLIHAEAAGADDYDMDYYIVRYDPFQTAGTRPNTYTVYESDGVTPMAGCEVWATSDITGAIEIANRGLTNDAGQHIFYFDLPAGSTVYIWRRKSGKTFTNPDTEVVA